MPETRRFCPHCEEIVSLSTFLRHKERFYNASECTWTKDADIASSSDEIDDMLLGGVDGMDSPDEISDEEGTSNYNSVFSEGGVEKYSGLDEEDLAFFHQVDKSIFQADDDFIDDGEFWDDTEPTEIDQDIYGDLSVPSHEDRVTTDANMQASQNQVPTHTVDEDADASKASKLVSFVLVVMSKWASRYHVTSSAVAALLRIISVLFTILGYLSSTIAAISQKFPRTLHSMRRALKLDEDDFVRFVVCPKCHVIYRFEDCFEDRDHKVPRDCSACEYPHHPHRSRRLPCGTKLLAEVIVANDCKKYYPHKVYCYKPLKDSLRTLTSRVGFLTSCEHWRLRNRPPDAMCDIYDGQVWKDFQYIGGTPFLALPYNLGFMLNIDWFSPYKHSPYSVGAIYLIVMNLPRSQRFKQENLILIGLIPGPNEPPLHVNTYLNPLVEELNTLWHDGLQVTSPDLASPIVLKAALMCSSCDVPATRKVCGFYGHMARLGCSKCKKEFTEDAISGCKCFGAFDIVSPLRCEQEHREQAYEGMRQLSRSARDKVEARYGSRFTALMHLEYFDCVRFHVIDPMHNLFLGTAKHVMKNVWLHEERPLISKGLYSAMQERVDNCTVPSSLGRIPYKIASNFSSFTADQWKVWTMVFSVYALYDVLKEQDLKCWSLFVQACQTLVRPMLTLEDAKKGHLLLLDFCSKFEELYGSDKVTPNMHLHTHLFDCIKDYGPVYGFWCFSFERYNGILGAYRTNNRAVEVQFMRHFLRERQTGDLSIPEDYSVEYQSVSDLLHDTSAGTLRDIPVQHNSIYLSVITSTESPVADVDQCIWTMLDLFGSGGIKSMEYLDDDQVSYLVKSYNAIYAGHQQKTASTSPLVHKSSQINFGNVTYGSLGSRSRRSSFIRAAWCGRDGCVDRNTVELRPAQVLYYFRHSILLEGTMKPHIFAHVQWYQRHPRHLSIQKPVEIWCARIFEPFGPASFVPIQRIHSQFVGGINQLDHEDVLFVCPLQQKVFL